MPTLPRVASRNLLRFVQTVGTLFCLLMISLSPVLAQKDSQFRSPLLMLPDPMLVTYQGHYYLYADDHLGYDRVWTSTSLAGIPSATSQVLYTPPAGSGLSANAVCVFIFHWNSRWYQYCTNSSDPTQARAFVLQSSGDNPLGPYTFDAYLDTPNNSFGYAEWPFQVGSQIYMLFTTNGQIWAAKYSDPVTRTGNWNVIASPISGGWDCVSSCIDEGGSVVVHGSKAFLIFSAGTYESPNYCVGLLTASTSADLSLQGSWTKSSGCVVSRNDAVGAYGPGSALWFKSPDGTQDWIVYHVKESNQVCSAGDDRRLEAAQVTWDGNGNPVFPQPYAPNSYHPLPSGDPGEEFSSPTASSWGTDRVTLHAIGAGHAIWERYWTSETGWVPWHQVGAVPPNGPLSGPSSTSRVSNYIDTFVATTDSIYTQYWNGSTWAPWLNLSGPPASCQSHVAASRPAAGTWGGTRLNLYTLGLDDNVWESYWTSGTGWVPWEKNMGSIGIATGNPATYSRITNYIDVFVVGADGNLHTNYWNGSVWNGWANFGAVPNGNASSPALTSWGSQNLTLYERSQDGNIYQQNWNGGWAAGWTNLGAPPVGAVADPTAVSRISNYIDLFVRGGDGAIWTRTWNGSSWNTWNSLGEP